MIVALDATVLIYIIDENAPPPIDPATGQAVKNCKERLDHLLLTLQKENAKIIIPTLALGEVLVKAQQAAPELLRDLTSSKHFRVSSFDAMAAVEYAAMHAARLGKVTTNRTKAKFDEQIVAIARVENATIIYSDDGDIAKLASPRMQVLGIASLPLPVAKSQGDMFEAQQEAYSSNPDFGRWS
ncbi:PIN domain-containing protein [Bradyrhizobium sp. LjRoot220]|uniref:PIN domain-containing protein n=1 Tax=Bradyrhizobium sp. LjRoot220 TaxID=3342284 RepID=UPI003ECE4A9D